MTVDVRQRLVKDEKTKDEQEQEEEVQKPKYWDPITEGLKLVERYGEPMEKFFTKLPEFLRPIIATFAIFTFCSTLRGEWVIILISALKQYSGHTQSGNVTTEEIFKMLSSKKLKMENFGLIFVLAHIVSFTIYFSMCGFLYWYYYVSRRHLAHEWKIQKKWQSAELCRNEIVVGTISLVIAGSFSAFLACYIINENPSTVYFQFDEYGWLWFFLQTPVIFIYMDYTTYIIHRLYHTRFMYKHFHKLHHNYKQPTMFSATAIHPVEILHVQLTMCLPLFTVPVHWLPFYLVTFYNFYHGIIDHSGIDFKAAWWQPWQPDATFHDRHHESTHCNYGFNMDLWDKLHGTMWQPKRYYSEDLFEGDPIVYLEEMETKDAKDIETEENTKACLNKDK